MDLARRYNADSSFMDEYSLEECFNFIGNLPYIADPLDGEYIQRPKYTYSDDATFRDCDDKCIALGSCLIRRSIPFKFVAVSEDPKDEIHHVVIKAKLPKEYGGWVFLDCTYPENNFLEHNTFYKAQILCNS